MTISEPNPELAISLGLAVFPLPPGGKRCQPGWHQTVTQDLDQIRATWPAGANIGVGCRASKVVGIDLDRHASGANSGVDGIQVFDELCKRWGQPRPVTLEIATPSNGRHLYLRVPPGRVIPSSSGGRSRLGPGIDIRGPGRTHGGYLVGPGSIVDGRAYVVVNDAPIAWLPGWLAALLERRPR